MVQKRFPATVSMELTTFLNDKKIDGELYALFQQYSRPDKEKRTVVMKKDLPTQADICRQLGIKSPKTYRTHRDYLIAQGYVVEYDKYYVLPNKEEIFFMIPLATLQFLNDTIKEQVIKVYIYLGQRWKYKQDYSFTIKEIGQHIGIKVENDSRAYAIVNNALLCLQKLGLIEYTDYTEMIGGRPVPKKKLVGFNFEIKELNR